MRAMPVYSAHALHGFYQAAANEVITTATTMTITMTTTMTMTMSVTMTMVASMAMAVVLSPTVNAKSTKLAIAATHLSFIVANFNNLINLTDPSYQIPLCRFLSSVKLAQSPVKQSPACEN